MAAAFDLSRAALGCDIEIDHGNQRSVRNSRDVADPVVFVTTDGRRDGLA